MREAWNIIKKVLENLVKNNLRIIEISFHKKNMKQTRTKKTIVPYSHAAKVKVGSA
jgi:hypothetical protein